MLKCFFPIIPESEFVRCLLHFAFAPGILSVSLRDEFLRRVRDHLASKSAINAARPTGWPTIAFMSSGLTPTSFSRRNVAELLKALADLFVRRLYPPREHRIVSVVKLEPLFQGRVKLLPSVAQLGRQCAYRRHAPSLTQFEFQKSF